MSLCTVFDSISSNTDEVPSINPSTKVFVFGDFNVYYKEWLTYSCGTGRSGELCYNFYISSDLTQIVNFPTHIPDCGSHSPALVDLFLSFLVFVLQWLSLHSEIQIMLLSQFPLTFHHLMGKPCFMTLLMIILVLIWDCLCDHLRDVPWEDIFKLSASAAASEFFEWFKLN